MFQIRSLILITGLAMTAAAQEARSGGQSVWPVPSDVVWGNTKSLKVDLKLDRSEYLAGEIAAVTVTVTNSSSRPLWVYRPFSVFTGEIKLMARQGDELKVIQQIDRTDIPGPSPADVVLLKPSESRERKIRTFDFNQFEDWLGQLTTEGSVPLQAGHYRFEYVYGAGAGAEFDVVDSAVRLVGDAKPSTPRRKEQRPPRRNVSFGRLRIWKRRAGTSWCCPQSGRFRLREPVEAYKLETIGPFVRLDSWEGRMPDVQIEVADDNTLIATWTTDSGTPKRMEIPPPRGPEHFSVVVK